MKKVRKENHMSQRKTTAEKRQAESESKSRYASLQGTLTERSRRHFAGSFAGLALTKFLTARKSARITRALDGFA